MAKKIQTFIFMIKKLFQILVRKELRLGLMQGTAAGIEHEKIL